MRWVRHLPLAVFFAVATSMTAVAQPRPPAYSAGHDCTMLNVYGGAATASSDIGGMLGGAAGWELTPWFTLEADAAWLLGPGEEHGFTAAGNVLVNLKGARDVVPFLKGGLGLYHVSLDTTEGAAPAFYRRRIEARGGGLETHSFTDPALVVGGGVNVFVSRNMAVRPQVQSFIVMRDSETRIVTAFTLHLAYHFDDQPITSSRTRR